MLLHDFFWISGENENGWWKDTAWIKNVRMGTKMDHPKSSDDSWGIILSESLKRTNIYSLYLFPSFEAKHQLYAQKKKKLLNFFKWWRSTYWTTFIFFCMVWLTILIVIEIALNLLHLCACVFKYVWFQIVNYSPIWV